MRFRNLLVFILLTAALIWITGCQSSEDPSWVINIKDDPAGKTEPEKDKPDPAVTDPDAGKPDDTITMTTPVETVEKTVIEDPAPMTTPLEIITPPKKIIQGLGPRTVQIIGNKGSGPGELSSPTFVAADERSGRIFVSDTQNHRIQVFDTDGNQVDGWGSFAGVEDPDYGVGVMMNKDAEGAVQQGDGQFNEPTGLAISPNGSVIFVADSGNHRIQKFSLDGRFLRKFGTYGVERGEIVDPAGLAFSRSGNLLISDSHRRMILVFDQNGKFLGEFPPQLKSGEYLLSTPKQIAVDKTNGDIYVADPGKEKVVIFSEQGNHIKSFGKYGYGLGKFDGLYGIILNDAGEIYISDGSHSRNPQTHRIQHYTASFNYIDVWGSRGDGPDNLNRPGGLALMKDTLYVADTGNHRVVAYDVSRMRPVGGN